MVVSGRKLIGSVPATANYFPPLPNKPDVLMRKVSAHSGKELNSGPGEFHCSFSVEVQALLSVDVNCLCLESQINVGYLLLEQPWFSG